MPALLRPLPLCRLRSLGGKYGEQVMSQLGVSTVGEGGGGRGRGRGRVRAG